MKKNQLVIAVLLALLLIGGGIYLSELSGRPTAPGTLSSRVPLFILWYLDATLIAATLFVIGRTIFKILIERRRGMLGQKFKTKLIVTHLALTAVPVALVFVEATVLLRRTIDRWFSTPVETIVNRAESLRDLADQRSIDSATREARALARILNAEAQPQRELRLIRDDTSLRSFDSAELYRRDGSVERLNLPPGNDLPPYPTEALARAETAGASHSLDVLPDGSRWFRAAARSRSGVVVVGLRASAAEAAAGDLVARAWSDYHKVEVQKSTIKATNQLLFALLTLALLFAAIWTGLTLARRITAPIEALAESTRKIAQGDLTAEVEVPASDELGVLVDSFNTMTAQLRENRGRLERSNEELVAINRRLDRERELLSTILQTARTGIVASDREGRVKLANPAALEILGLAEAPEMLADLQNRKNLRPIFESMESARRGEKPPPREFSPGGAASGRRAEVSVAPMPGEEGQPRGLVIALEDTTEIARAQKLEAWGEAARRVAHEIKNPLTPIRLSAERMVKKINAGDPAAAEAVRLGAGVIIEEVNLLKSLVDQFSRFSRLPETRPVPTDLEALARRTLALYEGVKEGVTLQLENSLPKTHYRLDGDQFQRVLLNLIDNALDASRVGGRVRLTLAERNGNLTIQVSDTGTGISPVDRERIFRSDFSTKPGSSGLGLAIVSRIVAEHRGTIRFEENHPRGSLFVIEIPAA
jgi:two-component system nitrogen regulation sensor histidine kinase NtrY